MSRMLEERESACTPIFNGPLLSSADLEPEYKWNPNPEEPPSTYDAFKIISKKALADYRRAERRFLDFLASADVWSQDEVTETIIDFHLVEKCRTKFRAFVKSFGARVKFDPVGNAPRKQEYSGTVTVTRACKQQFLTKHLQVIKPGAGVESPGDCVNIPDEEKTTLQCASPTPITTGHHYIAYTPEEAPNTPRKRGTTASGGDTDDLIEERESCPGTPRSPAPCDRSYSEMLQSPTTSNGAAYDAFSQEPVRAHSSMPPTTLGSISGPVLAGNSMPPWRDMNNQRRHSHPGEMEIPMHEPHDFPNTFTPSSGFDMHLNENACMGAFTRDEMFSNLPLGATTTATNPLEVPVPTFSPRERETSVSRGDGFFQCPNMHDDMHDFTASAAHQRRASCGPEFLKMPHASSPPGTLPEWGARGGSGCLTMGERRVSEPVGSFDPVAISGQKRRSDGFGVYTGLCSDLAHQAVQFINTSFEYPDGYDGVSGEPSTLPSPTKSPRLSYDAGEAFARHMTGYMHEDGSTPMSITGDACGSPRALLRPSNPCLFQDPSAAGNLETSANLSGPDPSMEGLWQMLASEPTLMPQQATAGLLDPRPLSEMERSEMDADDMHEGVANSVQPSLSSAAAPPNSQVDTGGKMDALDDGTSRSSAPSNSHRNITADNLFSLNAALGAANPHDTLANHLALGGVNLSDFPGVFTNSLTNEMSLSDLPRALTNALSISDMPPALTHSTSDRIISNFVEACLGSQPNTREPSFQILPLQDTNMHAQPVTPRAMPTTTASATGGGEFQVPPPEGGSAACHPQQPEQFEQPLLEHSNSSDGDDSAKLRKEGSGEEPSAGSSQSGEEKKRAGVTTRAQARSKSLSKSLSRDDSSKKSGDSAKKCGGENIDGGNQTLAREDSRRSSQRVKNRQRSKGASCADSKSSGHTKQQALEHADEPRAHEEAPQDNPAPELPGSDLFNLFQKPINRLNIPSN